MKPLARGFLKAFEGDRCVVAPSGSCVTMVRGFYAELLQDEPALLARAWDIGITGVDYAIAETGTCVLIARSGVSRLVSLLPPVHIEVVQRGQVPPSLDELFALRRQDFIDGALGSYMSLITGLSRSADIESTLVTGVHGPGEEHVVLVG